MSEHPRPLPPRPSLRYLKIEAKQRLSAGEFTSLHEAQLAMAREHGMSSWATLKAAVETAAGDSSPALGQVRWVAARFADADDPHWAAPDEAELREHFDDRYLARVPAGALIDALRPVTAQLRAELRVLRDTPGGLRAQLADLRVEAAIEPDPPHRLTRLRMYPLGDRVTDPRVAAPATRTTGAPPDRALSVAEESFTELGLAGLVLAGAIRDAWWAVARGWSDVDKREEMLTGQRFPAYGVTKLITATAVLCLVADGRAELDRPANAYLSTLRLSDDDVTVRALLTHTGGVIGPAELFADRVPEDPAALLGSMVPCERPGALVPSNGGYAVLGRLIADVTGLAYPDAAADLVLRPLGLDESSFPTRWPDAGAITGYQLTGDGSFEPEPRLVCTLPAAGGLWTTAADLVRFGLEWPSLLPERLRAEAVRVQARGSSGARIGLGWLVSPDRGVHGHPGTGPGAAVSLMVRPDTGTVTVACTNRRVPIEQVNARLIR